MLGPKLKMLLDTTVKLVRRDATHNLARLFDKLHGADLALLMRFLDDRGKKAVFSVLDLQRQAQLLSELDLGITVKLLPSYPIAELIPILHEMDEDDVADILGALPEDLAGELLRKLHPTVSEEVGDLMTYDADTAGGLMTTGFFALPEDASAGDAISSLQHKKDVEVAFYVYVVNDHGQLVGVLSLRQLVTVAPETKLGDFMSMDVIHVRIDADQEEVARLVARYNLLAIPVVDGANKLLGIVTVDDVIDVIREEATEDILRMAGAGAEIKADAPLKKGIRDRLPWLLPAFIGGAVAAVIISQLAHQFGRTVSLILFIPMLLALAGGIGVQSSTLVAQGLTTANIQFGTFGRFVLKLLVETCVLASFYAILSLPLALLLIHDFRTATVTSASILVSMLLASGIGAGMPGLFQRIGIDPAAASNTVVVASVDVASIASYMGFCVVFL